MLVRHRAAGAVAIAVLAVGALALPSAAQDPAGVTIAPVATLSLGAFDEGATEIVAFDPASKTVFSVNGETDSLDLIDLRDPTAPALTTSVALPGSPTSVDVANGIVAVAVLAEEDSTPGQVVFLDTAGAELGSVTVGAHPDDITFTPDGTKVLTADEGEPAGDYSVDGEGSITIVDLANGPENATATVVGFTDFNEGGPRAAELPAGVRIYGPDATVAQDLEPEFVVVSADGATAYASLQENNALAIVDIPSATVTAIVDLGLKDFSLDGNGIDPTDADGGITIAPIPAYGLYMPDQLGVIEVDGTRYLISANEGDTRDYEDVFSEESEVGEIDLDATAFPDAAALQAEGAIGKLETTLASGDTDGDGDFDQIVATGGRSISVWDAATGQIVWDSGDLMERTIAELDPDHFNSTNDEQPSFEDRSDNAGPEPEGLVLGTVGDRTYAFVGAERQSGIFVFDVTDPTAPSYVTYAENRDWTGDPAAGTAGDLGPEGLVFIPAADSPTGADLLLVANEVSGTMTVWSIDAA
jgi:hypothetical protein